MHLYISERVQYFSTLLKSTNKITTKGDKFHSRLFYQFLRFSGDMIQQCSFSRLFALLSWWIVWTTCTVLRIWFETEYLDCYWYFRCCSPWAKRSCNNEIKKKKKLIFRSIWITRKSTIFTNAEIIEFGLRYTLSEGDQVNWPIQD